MKKHAIFLRWWLLVTMITVSGYFCWMCGVFAEANSKDFTHITLIIVGGLILMSLQCGVKTFKLSSAILKFNREKAKNIKKELSIGYFACAVFVSLGLLGTLIGMVYALQGFASIDVSNLATVQGLIPRLTGGVSTALYTTIAGVISSILLKLQYFNLEYSIKKFE